MSDPKDLWSMWQVHPKFRSLSGESQTQEVLVSQLLSIKILPYLWEDHKTRMSKLKMCRTFSKGMRTSVDRLIEKDFMESLSDGHANQNRTSYCFKLKTDNMRYLDFLLTNFGGGSEEKRAKRVFHRAIQIHLFQFKSVEKRDRVFQFKDKVISLLKLIGDQVWHVGIHTSIKDEGFLLLQECVGLMPNLRWIEMNFYESLPVMASQTPSSLSSPDRPHHLFPFLRHLERASFRLHEVDGFAKRIHQLILRDLHIKRLDLDLDEIPYANESKNYAFVSDLKPLLSQLNLNAFHGSWSSTTIKILQAVPFSNWELKSLSLSPTFHQSLEMSTFIDFVNNISTLEHLSLCFKGVTIREHEQSPCLRLPNLKCFDMNFRSCNFFAFVEPVNFLLSPEFLLHSKNLKTINWSFVGWAIVDGYEQVVDKFLKEFVNIRHRHNSLTSCKLWDVFPKLRLVKANFKDDHDFSGIEFRRNCNATKVRNVLQLDSPTFN